MVPIEKPVAQKPEPTPVLITSSDEAMFKFDLTTQLYYRLIEGTTTPELMEQMNKMLGEDQVKETIKQVEALPAEQKKALIEYSKLYK